ncbi:MAG TPA: hypothetical protein VGB89_03320 [Bacteroidota bacterium]|jgi:hypothetical protein
MKLSQFTYLIAICLLSVGQDSSAGGKLGIYGIYMAPRGPDARSYSDPGYGLGFHVVAPVSFFADIVAGVGGLEYVNLLSATTQFRDRVTGLRVEQQTEQGYFRLFLGGQVGGHGNGFLRPHAGINLAFVYYSISTDVVIPDDRNRENEIRQSLRSEGNVIFGYDITFGLDLNFSNTIALDGGVKYLKSFSVPQQLGEGSVRVHPYYLQIYFGIGVSFDMIRDR